MRYLLPLDPDADKATYRHHFFVYLANWVIAHNVLWLCLALPPC